MKLFHWVIITTLLAIGAIVLYSISIEKTSNPTPADIGSAPVFSEPQKPEVPQLDSFSGLEEEFDALNQNSGPLKSGQ